MQTIWLWRSKTDDVLYDLVSYCASPCTPLYCVHIQQHLLEQDFWEQKLEDIQIFQACRLFASCPLQNRLPLWGWNRQPIDALVNRTEDHQAAGFTTAASPDICSNLWEVLQTSAAFSLLRTTAPIPVSSLLTPDQACSQRQHSEGCSTQIRTPPLLPAPLQFGEIRRSTKGAQYTHWWRNSPFYG